MPVYVDPLRDWGWRLGPSCHLVADSLDELHAFAERLGLKRSWFQSGRRPHYDLVASRRAQAVALGAVETDARGIILACRRCAGHEEPIYSVPAGTECLVRKIGSEGDWKPFRTTTGRIFAAPSWSGAGWYGFAAGGWEMRVERRHVREIKA